MMFIDSWMFFYFVNGRKENVKFFYLFHFTQMEESSEQQPKFKAIKLRHVASQSVHQPGNSNKSRIKVMHSKIFWNRNSYESSLERVISKDRDTSPNKL